MNRIPVKWIRDKAKTAYKKDTKCFICGTRENLELHHLASITLLFEEWCNRLGLCITTDEAILEVRDVFISEHKKEIYEDVFTLCKMHHQELHRIYGKAPELNTVEKQRNWINIQKTKKKPDFSEFLNVATKNTRKI